MKPWRGLSRADAPVREPAGNTPKRSVSSKGRAVVYYRGRREIEVLGAAVRQELRKGELETDAGSRSFEIPLLGTRNLRGGGTAIRLTVQPDWSP
jgi:hypothetical protein